MKRLRSDEVALAVTVIITVVMGVLVFVLRPQPIPLRVTYIASGPNGVADVWAVIPAQAADAEQLTFTEGGVFDYAPSPDGRKIAYAERDFASNRITLKLRDLASGVVTLLTDCIAAQADCYTPAWRPDGGAIAYVRTPYDPVTGAGVPNIWLIEGLESGEYREYQMFDAQTAGNQPVWSRDGQRLAFYEPDSQGVLVYDFAPSDPVHNFRFFPADNGVGGVFSPDGRLLITSALEAAEGHAADETPEAHAAHADAGFRPRLIVGDLETGETRLLLPEGQAGDGLAAVWAPDGRRIALLRLYGDGSASTQGKQVYLYDLASETLVPLIVDAGYNHGALSFSPDGAYLLVQRYAYETQQPQVWVYEMATGALTPVAFKAYIAGWLAGTA